MASYGLFRAGWFRFKLTKLQRLNKESLGTASAWEFM